ncbi:MAG: hypothetical protein V1794_15175 [Candidatus Glassbacteria bacterium]
MSIRSFLVRKNPDAKLWVFALLSAFAALWAGCSNERGDPLAAPGEGGSLSAGRNGPNLAVNAQNQLALCQEAFEQLFGAYLKALLLRASAPTAGETVRFLGNYTGYALVGAVQDSAADSLAASLAAGSSFVVTFYDFSESGKLFIGGSIEYAGSLREDLYLDNAIAFAGDYSGTMKFLNFRLPVDSSNNLFPVTATTEELLSHPAVGNVQITSGDYKVLFNPYFRMFPHP